MAIRRLAADQLVHRGVVPKAAEGQGLLKRVGAGQQTRASLK
jgi:hypothetical protein